MNYMLRRQLPFVLLAIFLVVFGMVAPQNVVDIGVYALIYGLAAIGLSLLMGLAAEPTYQLARRAAESALDAEGYTRAVKAFAGKEEAHAP